MIEGLKEKVVQKGMKLVNSPAVARAMESEQVGAVIEKAMSIPIKVSEGIRTHKERITSFMELATQEDLDELRRSIAKVEEEMRSSNRKSSSKGSSRSSRKKTSKK